VSLKKIIRLFQHLCPYQMALKHTPTQLSKTLEPVPPEASISDITAQEPSSCSGFFLRLMAA
jgi:hypothetical protein